MQNNIVKLSRNHIQCVTGVSQVHCMTPVVAENSEQMIHSV